MPQLAVWRGGVGISGRENSIDGERSSRERRVSPGSCVAMKAERLQDKGMEAIEVESFFLSGSSEAEGVVRIAGSGGVCCVLSFSRAWSQSESTDLASAVQNSQEVADIGGVPQEHRDKGRSGEKE